MLFIFTSISTYYIITIIKAREYTKEIVLKDIQQSQWRYFNGDVHKFNISLDVLTQRRLEILLRVEDPNFYNHNGLDFSTPGAGLTTITQGIVKKLYFNNFKSGVAKLKQSLIARYAVDDLISKNDQLNIFINMIYLGKLRGKPVIGLDGAAESYYNLTLEKLTEEQYISIVAMIIAPKTFHLVNHPDWNKERAIRIKNLISGDYHPKGLMDQYYGRLSPQVIKAGIAMFSYFEYLYKE
jgi:membrane carboxypeptidase/penicillin-binding protein